VEVPDHIRSIWSAQALMAAPDAVVGVHRDYIEAGADVITLNNYAVTPPLLAREGLEDRFEELTRTAIALAKRARQAGSREVRLAGSLPPLETSYRAERVGEDAQILADYRRLAGILAEEVDVLLCETLSSAREARAAATAACETGREVWLSWTLQGNRPDQLPSGETLAEAFAAVEELDIQAFLVNCCGANFVTRAIPILRSLTDRAVGGYANTADVVPHQPGEPVPEPELVDRTPLSTQDYADTANGWLDAGASIVGGCCSTGPGHIALLRQRIDSRQA